MAIPGRGGGGREIDLQKVWHGFCGGRRGKHAPRCSKKKKRGKRDCAPSSGFSIPPTRLSWEKGKKRGEKRTLHKLVIREGKKKKKGGADRSGTPAKPRKKKKNQQGKKKRKKRGNQKGNCHSYSRILKRKKKGKQRRQSQEHEPEEAKLSSPMTSS